MRAEVALAMNNIIKTFSGVHALSDVSFTALKGEIHALVGENGAGKSTLVKVLSGVYPASSYQGSISVFGESCSFSAPKDAEQKGIAIIHQELMVLDELSIAENIFLGHLNSRFGFVDWKSVHKKAEQVLSTVGVDFDVRVPVRNLGVGQKQLVEIAKALSHENRILILDEPTASLTTKETGLLFGVLRGLKEKGITIIYISHRMEEVFNLSDRITVLRDGAVIGTKNTTETSYNQIISMMVGREISDMYPPSESTFGEDLLSVNNFTVYSETESHKQIVKEASFHLSKGEVVGFSGLLGSGRTELLSAVLGAYRGKSVGEVTLKGKSVSINSPMDAIRHGIGFVTENRKQTGLIVDSTVGINTTLPMYRKFASFGFLNRQKENLITLEKIEELNIKTKGIGQEVSHLSGGNQQKIVIGKWLTTNPDILVMDEPTRGVDVGAKSEIYRIMRKLTDSGVGIIMISSDLQEVLGMSDRIYVMHEGKINGQFMRGEASEEKIMQFATGVAKYNESGSSVSDEC